MVANPQYLGPMIYEFAIFTLACAYLIPVCKKYQEKRNPVMMNMVLLSISLILAVLFSAISRVLRLDNAWELDVNIYLELLTISVSFLALANLFLLSFFLEVFHKGAFIGKNKLLVFSYMVVASVFIAYTITTGLYTPDLTEGIWLFLILISFPLYILAFRSPFLLAKKIEDLLDKRSTQILGMIPIFLSLIFIFFLADRFMGANFTICYYFGWLSALCVLFMLYLGVLQPKWFLKLFTKD